MFSLPEIGTHVHKDVHWPSGLFVVVSWISFVVPPDVIPGRMALLITLFLVLVNIFNTVTTNTPKAEGLTAIESWMLSCLLFVFGALVGNWLSFQNNSINYYFKTKIFYTSPNVVNVSQSVIAGCLAEFEKVLKWIITRQRVREW